MFDPTGNPCDWLSSLNWFNLMNLIYPPQQEAPTEPTNTPWDRLMERATTGPEPQPVGFRLHDIAVVLVAFLGVIGSIALATIAFRLSGPGLLRHLFSTGLTLTCSVTLTLVAIGAIARPKTN